MDGLIWVQVDNGRNNKGIMGCVQWSYSCGPMAGGFGCNEDDMAKEVMQYSLRWWISEL